MKSYLFINYKRMKKKSKKVKASKDINHKNKSIKKIIG